MNFNDVEYKNLPNDDECITNAVQIGRRLNEEASTIRSWANTYEDYLYIKKTNGRFQYTDKSIIQFEFIKKLRREKQLPHSQILEIIKENGFNQDCIGEELSNSKNPIGFQAFAEAMGIENRKQFELFMNLMLKQQQDNNELLVDNLKSEISSVVEDLVENKINDMAKQNKALEMKLDAFNERIENFNKESMLIYELQQKLINRHEEYENKKKGFFKRLFKK